MARRKGTTSGGDDSNSIIHLPMPDRLEPKATKRSLMTFVKIYFYKLFNGADGSTFKGWLGSVGNKDALTGNRMFDRGKAVDMVIEAAKLDSNDMVAKAKPGLIYKCIVGIMRDEGMGLKLRRREYQQLTHMKPAE